jgi:hypothetical protein
VYRLAEVPEWGAMLADGFRLMRTKTFVVLPPAMAFFVAVFGFNTFGEGLRRLVQHTGFHTGFLLRIRMLLVFAGLSFATVWIINHAGPAPWFADLAKSFNADLAYEHIEALSEMEGRGIGLPGGRAAVDYILDRFEAYGLDPGGDDGGYLHLHATQTVRPLEQPILEFKDQTGGLVQALRHQIDFSYIIQGHGGAGVTSAPITVVGFDPGVARVQPQDFKGLDLRGRVVLLVEGNAPPDFQTEALIRGAEGILWVSLDAQSSLRSQAFFADPKLDYLRAPQLPIFRVGHGLIESLLAEQDPSLQDVFTNDPAAEQSGRGWFARDLTMHAHLRLRLSEPQPIEVPSVLGYVPGSDFDLADEMVVVFARYDGLGVDPDGTVFPSLNNNASGVGVLLELARVWHEQNLDPRRSVMFVAWGGAEAAPLGAQGFFADDASFRKLPTRNFYADLDPSYIFYIDHLGAGAERLSIPAEASDPLITLIENAANEVGVAVAVEPEGATSHQDVFMKDIPWVRVRWEASSSLDPVADRLSQIQVEKLDAVGEALSLALTKLVRQTDF